MHSTTRPSIHQRPRVIGTALIFGACLILLALLGAGRGAIESGFTEGIATVTTSVPVGSIELRGLDRDQVVIVHEPRADVAIEATGHAFAWSAAAAEQRARQLSITTEQEAGVNVVTVHESWGLMLLGRTPYVSVRVIAPPEVEVLLR